MQFYKNTNDQNESYFKIRFYLQPIALTTNIANFLFCLWIFFSLKKFASYQRQKRKSSFLVNYPPYTAVFPLIRIISTQSILFVEWFPHSKNDQICAVLVKVSRVLYFISLLLIYVFPWLRQQYLYQQPSMRHLNTKLVKLMSTALILTYVLSTIAICFLIVFRSSFVADLFSMECVREAASPKFQEIITKVFFLLALGFVVNQIIIFSLFTYPLLQYKNSRAPKRNDQVSKSIVSTLKHAAASVGVSTSATFLTGTTKIDPIKRLPGSFRASMFDVAMCMVLFSVVVSFEKWRSVLCFSLSRKQSVDNTLIVSDSSSIKNNLKISS